MFRDIIPIRRAIGRLILWFTEPARQAARGMGFTIQNGAGGIVRVTHDGIFMFPKTAGSQSSPSCPQAPETTCLTIRGTR